VTLAGGAIALANTPAIVATLAGKPPDQFTVLLANP